MGLLKAAQGTLVLMWFELTLVLGSMAAGVVLFPLLLTSPRRFRVVFDRCVLGTWIKSIAVSVIVIVWHCVHVHTQSISRKIFQFGAERRAVQSCTCTTRALQVMAT